MNEGYNRRERKFTENLPDKELEAENPTKIQK
jgi:hypothetical protein